MTAEAISKVYESAIADNGAEFSYNADRDRHNRITAMYVYEKMQNWKGRERLIPYYQYRYEYTRDGFLASRTTYIWHGGQWQCAARHSYRLDNGLYSIAYSRWNSSKSRFDEPVGKMEYMLMPKDSVASVACYQRRSDRTQLELKWQMPVDAGTLDMDNYLTKK